MKSDSKIFCWRNWFQTVKGVKILQLLLKIEFTVRLEIHLTIIVLQFYLIHGLFHCTSKLSVLIFKYPTVTSARSCNNVGHLFWFTILAQHETNDVILYIHRVHKHRGNTFQRQNYKMRLKQRLKQTSLDWINSMQVKKILFTNVFFSWSLCLFNIFPSMVFPKHFYFSGLLT